MSVALLDLLSLQLRGDMRQMCSHTHKIILDALVVSYLCGPTKPILFFHPPGKSYSALEIIHNPGISPAPPQTALHLTD